MKRSKPITASKTPILISLFLQFFLLSSPVFADLPATVKAIKPSVVGIGTVLQTRTPPVQVFGTGFVVGDGNHVLTNAHVISRELSPDGLEYLAVLVGQGVRAEPRKATKVAISSEHDLALLKIAGPALTPIKLGDSTQVVEGMQIAFTGYPLGNALGLFPVTHRGIVSAITPIVLAADQAGQLSSEQIKRLRSPYEIFQLDATAYPGNSGSPMYLSDTGEVVAVVNMVFVKETKESAIKDPSAISYAIPIHFAKALLQKAGLQN